MELRVDVQQRTKDAFVISPVGSLNSHTFAILESEVERILGLAPQVIVFDMERLDYISSAGVRVIIKTRLSLNTLGGKLVFMNLQPQIRKVFDIINALPAMKIFTSVRELDDYLDVMQRKVRAGDM